MNENMLGVTEGIGGIMPKLFDWFDALNMFQKFLLVVILGLVFGVVFGYNKWEKEELKKVKK